MHKISKKPAVKWGIIALIALVLAVLAYALLKPKQSQPSYLTAPVERGDIEKNVMASGKVKALNTVDVGAQVSGEVTRLYVQVGDDVQKGDLIAQIDQITQNNNVSNQQAALQQSQAALQSARAEALSKQARLKSAYADLASRQSELKQAESNFARLQPLIAINAISQQEYDTQATSIDTAKAAVAGARAAIDTAKAAIVTTNANINSQQAAIRIAETNVSTAKEDLSYTTIRAPISGTVVSITTEQGTTVNANQTAPTLVTLADLSTVRINAQISEADVINVRTGMPAYFTIIGDPDEQYDAVLTAIEPAPERISETSSTDSAIYYVGYVEVANPDRLFRIDMTAQVYIIVAQAKEALIVPSVAIQERPIEQNSGEPAKEGYFVRVLGDDGAVEERTVTVGIDNKVNAQIVDGVTAGEQVIIGERAANAKTSDSDLSTS